MILLWGTPDDGPLAAVRDALAGRRAPVALVDQRHVLTTGLTDDGLAMPEGEVAFASVTAAYLRPAPSGPLSDRPPAEAAHVRAVSVAISGWADATPAVVVHPPSVAGDNTSKPFQLARIARHGRFAVPATLVTTSPEAAAAFVAEHGSVVFKSVSAHRSAVRRVQPGDLARLDAVRWAPTQFQAYVPGVDWRAHVVGGAVAHSCRVESNADDYRFAGDARVIPAPLPDAIALDCVALTSDLGLLVGGVDLRRSPDGRWYCFEVNPSPAFTYFERGPAPSVAEAVADLLLSGAPRHPER